MPNKNPFSSRIDNKVALYQLYMKLYHPFFRRVISYNTRYLFAEVAFFLFHYSRGSVEKMFFPLEQWSFYPWFHECWRTKVPGTWLVWGKPLPLILVYQVTCGSYRKELEVVGILSPQGGPRTLVIRVTAPFLRWHVETIRSTFWGEGRYAGIFLGSGVLLTFTLDSPTHPMDSPTDLVTDHCDCRWWNRKMHGATGSCEFHQGTYMRDYWRTKIRWIDGSLKYLIPYLWGSNWCKCRVSLRYIYLHVVGF